MSAARLGAIVVALITACWVPPASAQHLPLVFVHGYRSAGPTWADAAARLKTQLAVETMHPNLDWRAAFPAQAGQLQSTVQWVPGTPVAIAHSNGGLVAREWSKLRQLSGILTLSSPNQGAPIANNALAFANYNYQIAAGLLNLNAAFSNPNEGSFWIYHVIQGALAAAAETIDLSLFAVLGAGMELRSPAFEQERIGSSFMQAINSPANLARETRSVPYRVSIVTTVDDFHLGGVVRASLPERTRLFRASLYAAVGTLDYWGAQIASSGHPRDLERAQRILYVSFLLSLHEGMWCQAVSDPTALAVSFAGSCYPNDSVIPSWSHVLPGALSVPVPSAPEHILQTGYVTPLLYDILTTYMGVAQRGADGVPAPGSVMAGGELLLAGQVLHSPDRRYRLAYQHDGNLVVYRSDNVPVWWTGTAGTSPGRAWMQSDGNFVVYNASNTAVWHTHTYGNAGAYLSMQNNGSFVIRRADTVRLWGSPVPANELGDSGSGGGSGGGTGGGGAETLTAGMRIYPGQAVTSRDGRFALTYQTDGNLVLYGPGGVPRWSTQVFSSPGYAEMQNDGNFVVYASDGSPRWASGTHGALNARLVVHDDGNVAIYNTSSAQIWATHTGGS
jgi:hypothetical protein